MKKKGRWVKWVVLLLILAAAGFFGWKFVKSKMGGNQRQQTPMTGMVTLGSITSTVNGSGITKAKNSETITLNASGTVIDVFVEEGQVVQEGDPLFTIESIGAQKAVEAAQSRLEDAQLQLRSLIKNQEGLHLKAPFSGKLTNVATIFPGDTIGRMQIATLTDDTHLTLEQYYSYAYEGKIYKGQKMNVSIPSVMSSVEGVVEEVRMVSRISPEGTKLFCAVISIENPGTLVDQLDASAWTTDSDGVAIYPYESDKLQYYRTTSIETTVGGTVLNYKLYNYLDVKAGQVLIDIDADDSQSYIIDKRNEVEEAQKALDKAREDLEHCNAVAPITGKIIGLSIQPGQEVQQGMAIVTISDDSTIIINASVDERNISFIKAGMSVNLNQWGNATWGEITQVSLNSTINNGVATYPIVISADNSAGQIQLNSYIQYDLVASQADDILVVPVQAVHQSQTADGREVKVVYVNSANYEGEPLELAWQDTEIPEGYVAVEVETGISDINNVEIKSGLEEGWEIFIQMMNSDGYWG